jgi:3-oxoacyl-[acyl-carrier protein] reductase
MKAIVTGGMQGIGKSITEALRLRGDSVTVFDCVPEADICVDVSNVESIRTGFEKFFSVNDRLDILVNNAGIARDSLAIRLKEEQRDSVLDVNLKGAFFCAQEALKKMIKQERGYIINISSIVGIIGNPGQVNYSASKAGLIAVTKTLAREYGARNILVNAIAPGFIQTKMTESLPDNIKKAAMNSIALKRFGTPQDIANIVAFLTSGAADYITGQVIHLDGGMI